jgi:hypothetical protein
MSGVIQRARLARELQRSLGASWIAYRALYALQVRAGVLRRRLPATDWEAQPLSGFLRGPALADPDTYLRYRREQAPAFFFGPRTPDAAAQLRVWDGADAGPERLVAELASGTLRYFSHTPGRVGNPPEWHRNPFDGTSAPSEAHWTTLGDFSYGDIKVLWEPSRFGMAYALVRSYWRTGDNACAEQFWQLVESWHAANPPQRGVNWKCGQETSFRVMAWCFGLYGLLDAPATTSQRVVMLAEMIAVSGARIEANLRYALSQRNNHGISEGLGLWTIGLLFPEFRAATRWRARGRAVLESQARRLVYDDGTFAQHSVNYHRLMLHDYLWALRLGAAQGDSLSDELRARVGRAGQWLHALLDDASGHVPNYGQNDGALILPLNNCDYRDFRPVVQATAVLTSGNRVLPAGPWDEDLFWLGAPADRKAAPAICSRGDATFPDGGYAVLRSETGMAFSRAATFRDRPGQADQLHVDVWWRGLNVALDAGTYSYHAPGIWDNALARTSYHNTVTVDDRDQMDRPHRFLWLPWAHGRQTPIRTSPCGAFACWEGEHDGYLRLPDPVRHRRAILRIGREHWLVLDRLCGTISHHYRLHWLAPDLPYDLQRAATCAAHALTLTTLHGPYRIVAGALGRDSTVSLDVAAEDAPRGWQAPYYYNREPALSLAVEVDAPSTCFWTLLGPDAAMMRSGPGELMVTTGTQIVSVAVACTVSGALIAAVTDVAGSSPVSPAQWNVVA